jgi:hypothetical protein
LSSEALLNVLCHQLDAVALAFTPELTLSPIVRCAAIEHARNLRVHG